MEERIRPANLILEGIVGSTAYGLTTPDSDEDTLGIYAAPTLNLFGLDPIRETVTTTSPDACWHEVGKFARLAVNMNPTVYELLWLPDGRYTVVTDLGLDLIEMRDAFLSADRVRDAYLGYATSQFARLTAREDGSFSSGTRARTAKHARHMARLVRQGYELYTTGVLTVDVSADRDWYFEFSESTPEQWSEWFAREKARFAGARSVLGGGVDRDRITGWLERVRIEYLSPMASLPRHSGRSHFGDAPYCTVCGEDWPCTSERERTARLERLLVGEHPTR